MINGTNVLTVLASLVMALSIFDWVEVTSLPLLRNPAAITACVFIILFSVLRLPRVRFRKKGPLLVGVGFLLLIAVMEALRPLLPNSDPKLISLPHFLQWVQPIILFLAIAQLAEDPKAFKYIWGGVLLAGIFMSLMSNFQVPLFTEYGGGGRRGFRGVNLNREAYWYTVTSITLLWMILNHWSRMGLREWTLFGAFFSVLAAHFATASRGGFLALTVGVSLLLLLSMNRRRVATYVTVVPLIIGASVAILLSHNLIIERLFQAVSGEQAGMRDQILAAAWPLIMERPLIGYGPSYVSLIGEATGKGVLAAHNTYVQIAMAYGVPAMMIWLGLLVSIVKRAWRVRHYPLGGLVLALMGCTMIYAGFGDLGYNRVAWILFAIAGNIGLLIRYRVEEEQSVPNGIASPMLRTDMPVESRG